MTTSVATLASSVRMAPGRLSRLHFANRQVGQLPGCLCQIVIAALLFSHSAAGLAATEQGPAQDVGVAAGDLGKLRTASPAAEKPAVTPEDERAATRVDACGDPLPSGAIARIGSIRLRHTDLVSHVAYSPDGKQVASAGRDGIRLWETRSGRPLRQWSGRCDHLAFSPDGEELACAGNSEIRILDVSTGQQAGRFEVQQIRGVAYAHDGSYLVGWGGTYSTRTGVVVSSAGFVRLLDPKTGKTLREFEGHQGCVFFASLSPQGIELATSSQDNTIRIWETRTGAELRRTTILDDARLEQDKWLPHDVRVPLAFSPAGPTLAVAMPDFSVRLWEVSSGKELSRLTGPTDKILSLAFSNDGRYLVAGGRDETVRIWETQFGHAMAVRRYGRHSSWIECVAFSPDYQTVVSGSQDHTVRVFHLPAGRLLHPLIANRQRIRGAGLSPDGKWVATGGSSGIHVWETETGAFLAKTSPVETVNCVAFSPDGIYLASGSWEQGIGLWDVTSRNGHVTLKEVRHLWGSDRPALNLAFSPDGTKLVSGGGDSDPTVRLWDIASGKEVHEWRMVGRKVVFSSDGRYLAALGGNAVRIVEVDSGRIVRTLGEGQLGHLGVRAVSFLADGRLLLTAGAGSPVRMRDGRVDPEQIPAGEAVSAIRVWDWAEIQEIGQFRRDPLTLVTPADPPVSRCSVRREVHELAVSPDGRILATAEDDDRVLLYDATTGKELKQLRGHESRVTWLIFSRDGTRLITASSEDLTALVWDLNSVLGERAAETAVPMEPDAGDRDATVVAGRVVDLSGEPAIQPPPKRAADLAPPVRITAGGAPIDVDGRAAPFVGDFDRDGKNDLLVGQAGCGRLRIYRNVGTNEHPKFNAFEWFKARGRIAAVPIGCTVGFTPQLIDFDGDGLTDVLTGSFHEAALYVFRRNQDGSFAEAEVLENKHGDVQMGRTFPSERPIAYNATVFTHDWDGDGDSDLLLGKSRYCLVPNEGTREQPIFGDALPLEVNGEPISGGIIPPCVADWDGDGRDDLLASSDGHIVWYRNTGTRGRPVLEHPQILVSREAWDAGSDRLGNQPARPQAICAADLNGDGLLDLLLGDHYFVKRTLTEEATASIAKAKEEGNELRDACTRLIRERPDNETRQQRIERFRKALKQWEELAELPWAYCSQGDRPDYERHGNVWMYERLAPGSALPQIPLGQVRP